MVTYSPLSARNLHYKYGNGITLLRLLGHLTTNIPNYSNHPVEIYDTEALDTCNNTKSTLFSIINLCNLVIKMWTTCTGNIKEHQLHNPTKKSIQQ